MHRHRDPPTVIDLLHTALSPLLGPTDRMQHTSLRMFHDLVTFTAMWEPGPAHGAGANSMESHCAICFLKANAASTLHELILFLPILRNSRPPQPERSVLGARNAELAQREANPNSRGEFKRTPLWRASYSSWADTVSRSRAEEDGVTATGISDVGRGEVWREGEVKIVGCL